MGSQPRPARPDRAAQGSSSMGSMAGPWSAIDLMRTLSFPNWGELRMSHILDTGPCVVVLGFSGGRAVGQAHAAYLLVLYGTSRTPEREGRKGPPLDCSNKSGSILGSFGFVFR
jgi:hypothetical protein